MGCRSSTPSVRGSPSGLASKLGGVLTPPSGGHQSVDGDPFAGEAASRPLGGRSSGRRGSAGACACDECDCCEPPSGGAQDWSCAVPSSSVFMHGGEATRAFARIFAGLMKLLAEAPNSKLVLVAPKPLVAVEFNEACSGDADAVIKPGKAACRPRGAKPSSAAAALCADAPPGESLSESDDTVPDVRERPGMCLLLRRPPACEPSVDAAAVVLGLANGE
mmetsp:Transcript_17684/g.32057  ORF Transcript_17684/g.32057 Transcript_17684/m.32057 type:complete len:220 (+) Transcript_17684:16-675(+)